MSKAGWFVKLRGSPRIRLSCATSASCYFGQNRRYATLVALKYKNGPTGRALALVLTLVAVGVLLLAAQSTRAQPVLDVPDLTFLLLTAAWALSAVYIASTRGFARLSDRLERVPQVGAAALGVACCGLFAVSGAGTLNPSLLIVACLAVHWTLATLKPRLFPLVVATTGGLTWALLHSSLALLESSPHLAKIAPLAGLARLIYTSDWNVIHGDPECAEFDRELLYRLREGVCVFENVEFRNQYRINRLGTRDDESSLDAPRLVAVGDSYTLGWGVDEEQVFVSLIEAELGIPVLNAGISSYGTARELALLQRIDRSRLDTVILQYCGNDQEENRAYLRRYELGPKTEEEFQTIVEYHRSTQRFHPFRYVYRVYERLLAPPAMEELHRIGWPRPNVVHRRQSRSKREAVADFLNVLKHGPVEIANARLVVTDLGSGFGEGSQFLSELKAAASRLEPLDWRSRIEVVDVMTRLSAEHYFALDPHLNPRGHGIVAELLLAQLSAH